MNRLKPLLEEAGITQVDLAREAGLSYGSLNRIVNGHSEARPDDQQRIVDAFTTLSDKSYDLAAVFGSTRVTERGGPRKRPQAKRSRSRVVQPDEPVSARPINPLVPPIVGTQIDDYRLISYLGSGKTSDVYEAEAIRDVPEIGIRAGQHVALKFYNLWVLQQSFQFERIGRELSATSSITQDSIVKIYDFQISPLRAYRTYMVMEFVNGEDLYSYLTRTGGVPSAIAYDYALQLFSALGALHSSGVIHRDIKPENLMIDQAGTLKVMDFGVVKQSDSAGELTGTAQFLGTIRYAAPEHLHGSDCTTAADVYSAGAVLYFAMFGNEIVDKDLPFAQQVVAVLQGQVNLPKSKPGDSFAKMLRNVVKRCLAREPSHRYTSASDVLEDLKKWSPEKGKGKRKPNAAFMKPVTPDAALAAVVGAKPLPRTQLTKKLWAYIKKQGLQDPVNRRMINADAKLRPVFKNRAQVSMFEMTKLISGHVK